MSSDSNPFFTAVPPVGKSSNSDKKTLTIREQVIARKKNGKSGNFMVGICTYSRVLKGDIVEVVPYLSEDFVPFFKKYFPEYDNLLLIYLPPEVKRHDVRLICAIHQWQQSGTYNETQWDIEFVDTFNYDLTLNMSPDGKTFSETISVDSSTFTPVKYGN